MLFMEENSVAIYSSLPCGPARNCPAVAGPKQNVKEQPPAELAAPHEATADYTPGSGEFWHPGGRRPVFPSAQVLYKLSLMRIFEKMEGSLSFL
jgi:hypothetical protein